MENETVAAESTKMPAAQKAVQDRVIALVNAMVTADNLNRAVAERPDSERLAAQLKAADEALHGLKAAASPLEVKAAESKFMVQMAAVAEQAALHGSDG